MSGLRKALLGGDGWTDENRRTKFDGVGGAETLEKKEKPTLAKAARMGDPPRFFVW
jgi:hypothetical protein